MERRSFVQGAGLAGVLAAGVAPAVVHAQANIRWRLASSFPKSLDTIFGTAEVFSKQVSEMTGGKFQHQRVHRVGQQVFVHGEVARHRRDPGQAGQAGAKLPLWVVIGPDGKVAHYHVGLYKVNSDEGLKELEETLIRVIKESRGK